MHTFTHTDTHTHAHTHTHNTHTRAHTHTTHTHLYPNVHSIRLAYMVQNTSDIIYSVNKYCQVELYVCDIKYLPFKL